MAARLCAEDDVFSDCHSIDQHEMLMNHPDAKSNGIMRRLDIAHLAINQNLTAIGPIKSIRDTHRRRFSGTIFTDYRVNRTRLDLDIHVIVSDYVTEAFCYVT